MYDIHLDVVTDCLNCFSNNYKNLINIDYDKNLNIL